MVELLLNYGADTERRDRDDRTPMSLAALVRKSVMFELLLNNGADTKSKDNDGRTPLYLAGEQKQWFMVRQILDKGDGRIPLSCMEVGAYIRNK